MNYLTRYLSSLEEQVMSQPWIMWPILICAVLAFFIIVERLWHFHRAQIDVPEFLHGLLNVLRRNNTVEAIAICDETPGPVAHVLRAAILHCDKDEAGLRRAVEETQLTEIPRLERHLKGLATIAHISPLLGLLGTVLGMMGAFQTIQGAGPFVSTMDLAANIWQALVTTAFGLVIAIIAYVAYNYLVSRVEGIVLDMEKGAGEMIYFLTHHQVDLGEIADAVGGAHIDGAGAE